MTPFHVPIAVLPSQGSQAATTCFAGTVGRVSVMAAASHYIITKGKLV
jgi:hypothetical protein